jgi:hypothetical protein
LKPISNLQHLQNGELQPTGNSSGVTLYSDGGDMSPPLFGQSPQHFLVNF